MEKKTTKKDRVEERRCQVQCNPMIKKAMQHELLHASLPKISCIKKKLEKSYFLMDKSLKEVFMLVQFAWIMISFSAKKDKHFEKYEREGLFGAQKMWFNE